MDEHDKVLPHRRVVTLRMKKHLHYLLSCRARRYGADRVRSAVMRRLGLTTPTAARLRRRLSNSNGASHTIIWIFLQKY